MLDTWQPEIHDAARKVYPILRKLKNSRVSGSGAKSNANEQGDVREPPRSPQQAGRLRSSEKVRARGSFLQRCNVRDELKAAILVGMMERSAKDSASTIYR